ncbi:helix-turn-helix domain-containing protein [Luteimonas sp. RD2P54]|uniref:Helix-turn-helix domain-containing protein n=1 Tax=Luteimonas endophytica TaxID=3042023 RepID=A0ABT6JCY3_9GAMM|nr:helix-turn-helix domain-containing protein [Luteimonas endophytica]MDH5824681.1 helix-turn-helix domain-containing protein [Luteimonas endophytica]
MQEFDVVLRVAGATLLLTVAALLVRDAGRERIAWIFLALALGLCGFLAGNTPDAGLKLSGAAAAVASAFSGTAAVPLWWFCLAVFDDDFRFGPIEAGGGAAWVLIAFVDRGLLLPGQAVEGLSWVLVTLGAGMVAQVGFRLWRDLEGDLVERRRCARMRLSAALALLLLVDLGVDLLLGFAWKPLWFTLLQNAAILALAAWLAHRLLQGDAAPLAFRGGAGFTAAPVPAAPVPSRPPADGQAAVDDRLLARLDVLMEVERVHRDPGLSFAAFAARMGAPEAEVRRLVNHRLGARHFRSFLNRWRVAEARRALADPARAGEKMVAIAFDAGFASLASFNRAFKHAEGIAPSEYRAAALERTGRPVPDTAQNRDGSAGSRLETGF